MFKGTVLAGILTVATQAAGGYDYSMNGKNWGETYPLCDSGREQSPIDLEMNNVQGNGDMSIQGWGYENFPKAKVSWNSNSVGASFDSNAELLITFPDQSGNIYTPIQLHIHSPSEHTVNGRYYDAELHIVHTHIGNGVPGAVIGIFFDMGSGGTQENEMLNDIWNARAKGEGEINLAKWLSTVKMEKYWQYDGSFTTPPCTEGIVWTVIEEVQPISPEQLLRL